MNKKFICCAITLILLFFSGVGQNSVESDSTGYIKDYMRNQDSALYLGNPNHSYEESSAEQIENEKLKPLSKGDFIVLINRFWMVIAALLVFFMQAGFKVFEVGLVRKIDGDSVGFKNLADWLIVMFIFWIVGFAFMFGDSMHGLIGTSYWGLDSFSNQSNISGKGYEFFLFQMAFAATAVTIVSGALAVRIKLISYMILACLVSAFIYPVYGHWVWGSIFSGGGEAWLYDLGFRDFAGSTVVHSVGAWVAITGMWFIRPRIGKRIVKRNKVEIVVPNQEHTKFEPHNLGYSVLGVLILWIGWWGFNGGSTDFIGLTKEGFAIKSDVPLILLNTNLAGVWGGLGAFCYSYWFQKKKDLFAKTLGGVLGGLVAITAGCDVLTPITSMVVGLLAGVIHNISYKWLNENTLFGKIIDDPVGAIPVHGVCGILGTLCVAFGNGEDLHNSFVTQFGIQLFGVIVCAIFTIGISSIFFYFLKRTIGLEVEPEQESRGETFKK